MSIPKPDDPRIPVEKSLDPPANRLRGRVREWIKALHHDPTAEERAMEERRQRLLDELTQAVAEAPDDVPIRTVIEKLNRHRDD